MIVPLISRPSNNSPVMSKNSNNSGYHNSNCITNIASTIIPKNTSNMQRRRQPVWTYTAFITRRIGLV